MRTDATTDYLIVQSQRHRGAGHYHRIKFRVVKSSRQHTDIDKDINTSELEIFEDFVSLLLRCASAYKAT